MDRLRCLLLLSALACTACHRTPEPGTESKPNPAEQSAPGPNGSGKITTIKPPPAPPAPVELWKEFSSDKALAEVRRQVELGPRPSGSPELEKARVLIVDSLRRSGWLAERQTFTGETPQGPLQFTNLIARFAPGGPQHPPSHDTQRALVGSHYDTKRFTTIKFVGADDGASSTGGLLELARVLALDPVLAAKIELVFFDGQEAIMQPSETDGLYGSRYYAGQLAASKRAAQFKFGMIWNMIGKPDLKITMPPDSPPDLARDILAAADALHYREHFGYFERLVRDDHEPLFRRARIPTIDLVGLENPYWHTADDTLDHLAPESAKIVGAVTLYHLRKALGP